MKYGYARCSTAEQKLDLQIDALKAFGCEAISQEHASAAKERPVLKKLLVALRPGDTLVVWKLDRLGRSLKQLVELVEGFQKQEIHFISLQDHLDTTTAQGRLVFNLFASLAEFERDLIRERTNAGLAAARARGRQGGRPKGLSKEALSKAEAAKTLYLEKNKTVGEIGKLLGVGRATIYRYLAHLGVSTGPAAPEAPEESATPPAPDFKFKKGHLQGFYTKYLPLATTEAEKLSVYYLNDITQHMDEDVIAHVSFEHLRAVEVETHKMNNLPYFLKNYAQGIAPADLIAGVKKFAGAYWLESGGDQFPDYGNHKKPVTKANFKISSIL